MARIDFKGIEEYADRLGILWKDSEKIIKRAVYEGAGVVADQIKTGLKGIPIDNRHGTPENPVNGITRQQKSDLINAFGLSPMENQGGYVQTKAGFDGYGSIPTKKYKKGVPNAMLMRSVESGTSFRKKHPVIRKAVANARKPAEERMGQEIDNQLKDYFG